MMSPCPDVSIIIPAHDRVSRLIQVLRSLRYQNRASGLGYEVIVVDDCSREPLQAVVPRDVWPDETVWLRNAVNLGDRRSRDRGVSAARGSLVILLDSDMVVHPGWLDAHGQSHAAETRIAVTGHYRHPPELGPWQMGALISVNREYRMRCMWPDAAIRHSSTTANMSLARRDYEAARVLADDRWAAHPEFAATFGIYGWKDIEFITALVLTGTKLRYNWDAWSWHYDVATEPELLNKALRVGIGQCRYAVLYPDMARQVLDPDEAARLKNALPVPSRDDFFKAAAHLASYKILSRLGLKRGLLNHLLPLLSYCRVLGTELAKREEVEMILASDPCSSIGLAALQDRVERTPVRRSWLPC